MAKRFEFCSGLLELDVAGHPFTLDPADPALLERVRRFGEEAVKFAKEPGGENAAAQVEDAIAFCDRALEDLLGPGAAGQIFSGRGRSLFDRLDVLNYLVGEVNAFQEERVRRYSPARVARHKK